MMARVEWNVFVRRQAGLLAAGVLATGAASALVLADPVALWAALARVLAFAILPVGLVAGFGFVRVFRFGQQRILRLREAAANVGTDAYVSAGIKTDDQFGWLSRLVDQTHAQIRATAAERTQHRVAVRNLVAEMSHDLRTPVSAIVLALEEAARDAGADGPPGPMLDVLHQAADIVVVVDGLRFILDDWSGSARDAPPSDLADAVRAVASRCRPLARWKGVTAEFSWPDEPVPVPCPAAVVEQAIRNLVHDAIRRGEPGGRAAVLLERTSPGRFRVMVVDDGPGLPPDRIPRLTDAYDPAGRLPMTRGFGLAVCQEICTRCGWTLTFEPESPRGVRATLEGPLATPRPANP